MAQISPVGALSSNVGTGTTSWPITTTDIGNAIIVGFSCGAASGFTISSVTGGGCTGWIKIAGPVALPSTSTTQELWIGQVITVGTANASVTWSSSISGKTARCIYHEFTAGSTGTTWSLDGAGNSQQNASSSTTVTYPTLTPSGPDRMYVGRGVTANQSQATGQTSGYTVDIDGSNNAYMYNPDVPETAQSPITTQNISGTSCTLAGLVIATTPPGFLPRRNRYRHLLVR